MIGRPTKMTATLTEGLLLAIRAGVPLEVAAQSQGISSSAFWDWMAAGEGRNSKVKPTPAFAEFAEKVRQAEAEAHVFVVATIRTAINKGNWQAAIAWAKMRWPKQYAERSEVVVDIRGLAERYASSSGLDADELVAEAERILAGG